MIAEHHPLLFETLRQAQRFGFFGAAPIEVAVEHSMGFVRALEDLGSGARIADLGSGGGLPGLLLADRFPHCRVVLIDRRQKRTDFLQLAVSRLGFEHVSVRSADASVVADDVESGRVDRFDAVTARGFGPPELTLRLAARLLSPTGAIVISEPPHGERWDPDLLGELGLASSRLGSVRRFEGGSESVGFT